MVDINASVYAVGAEGDIEDGEVFLVQMNADSGAAPTLPMGQLGDLNVVGPSGTALPSGALKSGYSYMMTKMGDDAILVKSPPIAVAVTATADGLTTGLIPADADFVSITSAAADNIATLPAASIGKVITGWVGANGCELRTPATSGATINDVDSDGTNEAAIPATTLFRLTCVTATGWILEGLTELGADIAAIVPDAA